MTLSPEQLADIAAYRQSCADHWEADIGQAHDAIDDLLGHAEALAGILAARDQWADQLTEQYATREVEFKEALEEMIRSSVNMSTDYASRMRDLYHNQEVRIAAAKLNITLD